MIRPAEYVSLRKKSFSSDHALPQEILQLAREEKSHAFLENPAALLCHVYLVDYIAAVARRHFSNDHPLRILDWGCGKGHVTWLIQQALPDAAITSCDVAGDLAKDDSTFGQETPIIDRLGLQIVPLTHEYLLPFAEQSFDLILSSGVLEHVPNDRASLKEINRVLSSDGLFFCTFLPFTLSWTQFLARRMGDTYHDRLYDWKKVAHLLDQSGLRLEDSWHRALFPKNPVRVPFFRKFEGLDQWLCDHTPLKYLATNIEFIACKNSAPPQG